MGKKLPKGLTSDLRDQVHKQFEKAMWWLGGAALGLLLGVPGLTDLVPRCTAMLAGQEVVPIDPLVWLSAGCLVAGVCAGVVSLMYYRRHLAYDAAFKQRREDLSR